MSDPTMNSSLMGFRFAEYADGATHKSAGDVVVVSRDTVGNAIGLDLNSRVPLNLNEGIKTIQPIGDSIIQLMQSFGLISGQPAALTGIVIRNASLNTPLGTFTWAYNAARKSLRFGAPGDALGPEVILSSGVHTIYSANGIMSVPVSIKFTELPTSDVNVTAATTGYQWQIQAGGSIYQANSLCFNRFRILPDLGVSGNWTDEMVASGYDQAIARRPTAIYEIIGTNDVQAKLRTPAQVLAARAKCWDKARAAGIPVISNLISPRWGFTSTGAATADSVRYQKQLTDYINAINAGLNYLARRYNNVFLIDCFSPAVNPSSAEGRLKDGYAADGLHDDSALSYVRAVPTSRILNMLHPDDGIRNNSGISAQYDATYNRGGSLLAPGQGQMAGTTGTAGTGVTMGTGIATGYTLQRSGAGTIVATGNKILDPDGGPEWQEIAISGATANGEAMLLLPSSLNTAAISVGDVLNCGIEWKIVGSGCLGLSMDLFMSSGGYSPKNDSFKNILQGMRDGEVGRIAIHPYEMQPGMVIGGPRFFTYSKAGATFKIWYRSTFLFNSKAITDLLPPVQEVQ